MNQGLIPNRYAKALFKVASDRGTTERVYELMSALAASFAAEPTLSGVIANPYVTIADKNQLLMTASHADKDDTCFVDFLTLLHQNHRIDFIRDIALAYLDIYRKANNISLVKVTTATKLPEHVVARLKELVESHLGGAKMEFSMDVDSELIGGFVVDINSERMDASLANELKQLRLTLLSN